MTLAAIFISPTHLGHIFGRDHKGFTINLGGKYFYTLSESANSSKKIVKRESNPSYLAGFWNPYIKLVSAIVGENGVGKTSIMDLFRLPSSYCWYIVEEDDESYIVENTHAWDIIYFSAFFNQNMYRAEEENFYDYSKYSLMQDDTEYEQLSIGPLMELHESENLKRWISFARLRASKRLLDKLKLPSFEKVKLRLNSFIINEHQTSHSFRAFFRDVESKLEAERERREQQKIDELGLTREQVMKDRSLGNEIRLELHIIRAVMNKVRNILESTGNKYLSEGELRADFSTSSPLFAEQQDSRKAFYAFLEHAFIKLGKREILLPVREIKNLINLLISCISKPDDIENTDELELDFDTALKLMDAYEAFLLAFKDDFAYDKKILMQFMPLRKMSSGERGLYDLFSVMLEANRRFRQGIHKDMGDFNKRSIVSERILLLLDEGDLGFHPEWKKQYVNAILQAAPFLFPEKVLQIIITTHDPLTLSDFPKGNVTYLKREGETTINYPSDQMRSFGANISTMLKNSFFVRNGLIGDFAKVKIDYAIKKLNSWIVEGEKKSLLLNEQELEEIKKIIGMIDEPIIQQKLLEMYSMVSVEDKITKRIREMEQELKLLKEQKGNQP
ncbi:hypothetical protein ASE74_01120 [Pedobacter sp. Leaf216]|uniref:AAA family ATPase n=1 Tax=Pedobacter sp. Leaf216 TaxID=1735684 RepID=UPI0006F404D7|nr:AAA family ATPase [Pedobacter sp. Leaf216]KQM79200.1 hypothetical protein ASE74_01120 [Pedobacter sp. Leaf216]